MATETTLHISGMDCGHCAARLGQSLERLDGVIRAAVDHPAGTATVRFDEERLSEDDLGERVRAAGFDLAWQTDRALEQGPDMVLDDQPTQAYGEGGQPQATYRMKIGGMSCSFCTSTIRRAYSRIDGVHDVGVSLAHEEGLVTYDPAKVRPDQLRLSTAGQSGRGSWPAGWSLRWPSESAHGQPWQAPWEREQSVATEPQPPPDGAAMGDVAYTSKVSIVRDRGPQRTAWLPGREAPITFGVHGAVAAHYGVEPEDFSPDATTLDYLVAAAGGWLTGTFGGALEARGIPAGGGRLRAEITGQVELVGKTLVVKRIHAAYTLQVDEGVDRDRIERTHGFHADHCPVARSIRDAIEVTTSYELVTA